MSSKSKMNGWVLRLSNKVAKRWNSFTTLLATVTVSTFLKSGPGQKLLNKGFGLSYDDSFKISAIPQEFPDIDSFCVLAKNAGVFEVILTDRNDNTIVLRESNTGIEHQMDIHLYYAFFVPTKTVDISGLFPEAPEKNK